MTQKRCPRCRVVKPLNEFHRNSARRDGHAVRCKICAREITREWYQNNKERAKQYQRDHRERINAQNRARRQENLEFHREKERIWREQNREKARAAVHQWRLKNPERHALKNRRWARRNPEKVKTIERRYHESHPEVRIENTKRRRARLHRVGGTFTEREWHKLLHFYKNTCLCCGVSGEETPEGWLTQDHIKPITKGGRHAASNIQPLCRSCNSKKGNSTIDYRERLPDWIKRRGKRTVYKQLRLWSLVKPTYRKCGL